ncbi:uncharacterized protein [Cicer arietinum]|uniref:Uncharacterized protein LOC101492756 n=1 Tax=Cicer arietinum TaxID=3827 RepID=A0A1S2Z7S9_CICAR|nr:uncharacterized protein LOC101492756 [Cicer arietinum]
MAPNTWDVLSESKRIIKSQPSLYNNLTLIFLLPLSFSTFLYQILFKHFQQQQQQPNPTLIFSFTLSFLLFSSIFTYSAVIAITYSIYHGFFNRPIKLKEAIKSIATSFFPLLATSVVTFVIFFFIFFLIILLSGLVFFHIIYLGDTYLENDPYYLVVLCSFAFVLMIVVFPLVMYLMVNFSLVNVIVVVESCWGLEPLRRSWRLVKGMKRLILSTFIFFGLLQWILLWIVRYNWVFIFMISPILAMLMLYNIAVYTMIYIYCKENHGELGEEKDGATLPLIP